MAHKLEDLASLALASALLGTAGLLGYRRGWRPARCFRDRLAYELVPDERSVDFSWLKELSKKDLTQRDSILMSSIC